MAVLKVADVPKPRSEARWLRGRGAGGEEPFGRAELCGPARAAPAETPGMAGKGSFAEWERRAAHGKH